MSFRRKPSSGTFAAQTRRKSEHEDNIQKLHVNFYFMISRRVAMAEREAENEIVETTDCI